MPMTSLYNPFHSHCGIEIYKDLASRTTSFINAVSSSYNSMVLDNLSDSLKGTLERIKNSLFVDEKLINELVKDIQRALLQSDVNVKLVFDLAKNIKERALKEEPPRGLTKK